MLDSERCWVILDDSGRFLVNAALPHRLRSDAGAGHVAALTGPRRRESPPATLLPPPSKIVNSSEWFGRFPHHHAPDRHILAVGNYQPAPRLLCNTAIDLVSEVP